MALLLDYMNFISGAYEALLRKAFHAQAIEHDVNLLLVYGRGLDDSDPVARAHNAIFDLLHASRVDGAILAATSLSGHCGSAGLRAFAKRLEPMALCSIGVDLPAVPTVTIDNHAPTHALVTHLIEEHGKRRIAFLKGTTGNREGDARFRAYRDALASHGLSFDEALVAQGDFVTWTARTGMQEIIDRTRDFDAVVAANDGMAVGAIETLWQNGIHVPRDVAVTGFDDLLLARLGNPPLTTVAQPIDAIAARAFELVLDAIDGKPGEPVSCLPTEVVLRRSCGCAQRVAPTARTASAPNPADYLAAHLDELERALTTALRDGGLGRSFPVLRLLRPLLMELQGARGAFNAAIDDLLEPMDSDIERSRACQEVITQLRDALRPVTTPELDDLLFDGFSRVTSSLAGAQVGHQLHIDNRYHDLLTASERVSVALDEASLRDALGVALPALGVETAFVSLLDDSSAKSLRPLVCLRDGELQSIVGSFDAHELFPAEGYPPEQRHTVALFPLVVDAQLSGVAAFDYERESHGFSTIRDNISAALRSVRLHEELLTRTRLHERSILEKQATAKRIESLSVLAGGVAHDLNNALGPLVALPDLVLRELDRTGVPDPGLARSRQDLLTMRTAAQRAVQTIRDLLTLGRQGRVQKEPLDLARTVTSAVLHGGSASRGSQNVRVAVEPAREPLPVRASEAHLVRAVSNLVQNAVESSTGGTVVVRTGRVHIEQPYGGYETVEPGCYGVVTIADEGSGMGEEQLARIFEPFFSTKKLGERSGSGLGLAIVHGVVKEHGGFVDVASSPGKGTTFTLYFPLTANEALETADAAPSRVGSGSVLVLDDDPLQRGMAERILEHLGYRVEAVATGSEAFQRCMNGALAGRPPYDLLVFDVVLNETIDGVEWYERIKRRLPDQRAILVSGHMPTGRVERAVANGLGWLAKPYTASALADAVANTLGPGQVVAV